MTFEKKEPRRRYIGADEDKPGFVRGRNATPQAVGRDRADDVAWSIAEELESFLYKERIPSSKNAAWFFKAGQAALDRSDIRNMYREHHDRFRNGDGKQLTLAEFGRMMVRYFRANYGWAYCNTTEDIIGMFYNAVVLEEITRCLWRVYADRRAKKGIE